MSEPEISSLVIGTLFDACWLFRCMGGRGFSVEVRSKDHISVVQLAKEPRGVLIEGSLGEMQSITVKDEAVLVFKGENGTLRLDLSRRELFDFLDRNEPIRERPWV